MINPEGAYVAFPESAKEKYKLNELKEKISNSYVVKTSGTEFINSLNEADLFEIITPYLFNKDRAGYPQVILEKIVSIQETRRHQRTEKELGVLSIIERLLTDNSTANRILMEKYGKQIRLGLPDKVKIKIDFQTGTVKINEALEAKITAHAVHRSGNQKQRTLRTIRDICDTFNNKKHIGSIQIYRDELLRLGIDKLDANTTGYKYALPNGIKLQNRPYQNISLSVDELAYLTKAIEEHVDSLGVF